MCRSHSCVPGRNHQHASALRSSGRGYRGGSQIGERPERTLPRAWDIGGRGGGRLHHGALLHDAVLLRTRTGSVRPPRPAARPLDAHTRAFPAGQEVQGQEGSDQRRRCNNVGYKIEELREYLEALQFEDGSAVDPEAIELAMADHVEQRRAGEGRYPRSRGSRKRAVAIALEAHQSL
jgi:hypothetical protein